MAEDDSRGPGVDVFAQWYTDLSGSTARDEMTCRALGLPADLRSTSLLPGYGIDEIVAALDLGVGRVLLDLACGRGGYGLEIARRTGARLVGVDFSEVAVGLARERAHTMGLADRAEFQVGELTRTGLAPDTVDAVLCVDSIQFAQSVHDALVECRRVLRAGQPLAVTTWEPRDRADDSVPKRYQGLDLAAQLPAAGFAQVRVREMPAWHKTERTLWETAVALDPGDDAGLRQMREEGQYVLARFNVMRRVFATATAEA